MQFDVAERTRSEPVAELIQRAYIICVHSEFGASRQCFIRTPLYDSVDSCLRVELSREVAVDENSSI